MQDLRVGNVVYLTGAPAAGKTTIARLLSEQVSALRVFEYGAELTELVQERAKATQVDIRERSSKIVTPDDIKALDATLLRFVQEHRDAHHIVIDSHPVTKESYGFRVTPFALDDFRKLNPNQIWVLYTSPETALTRIAAESLGRPTISTYEALFHTNMQASVAITYGMAVGIPIHLFSTECEPSDLAHDLARRLENR